MISIRKERPGDEVAIAALVDDAFANAEHSDGTEAMIVDRLRLTGALTLSLVAEEHGSILGHAAFSPVAIGNVSSGWYGLGPVAVHPDRQREGIGNALIRAGLGELREMNAEGCVVLGDPAYYGRFGFAHVDGLSYGEIPPEYMQILPFGASCPTGEVAYHPAFGG